IAARNCRDEQVCLLQQDIRALCLPSPVDLATANTFTLNHFLHGSEMRMAFRRIHRNLRPGGNLIFDLITHCQPWRGSRIYIQRPQGAAREMIHEITWIPSNRMLSIRVTHFSDGAAPAQVELYLGRGYSPLQIGRWLRDAGFQLRGIHNALTLRIADWCPSRVVLVARK